MAEDYEYDPPHFDEECEYESNELMKKYLKGNLKWKTKNGIKINVQDMELSHLENCIRVLNKKVAKTWILIFKYELKQRNNGSK